MMCSVHKTSYRTFLTVYEDLLLWPLLIVTAYAYVLRPARNARAQIKMSRNFYPSVRSRPLDAEIEYGSSSQQIPISSGFWSPGETITLPQTMPPFIQTLPSCTRPRSYKAVNSTPSGPPLSGSSDVSSLRQVVESQKNLEAMLGKILDRITNLETRMACSPTSSSISSGSEVDKGRLPPELSVSNL